jgi:hypothetical protein
LTANTVSTGTLRGELQIVRIGVTGPREYAITKITANEQALVEIYRLIGTKCQHGMPIMWLSMVQESGDETLCGTN